VRAIYLLQSEKKPFHLKKESGMAKVENVNTRTFFNIDKLKASGHFYTLL
jgi:hypothetical protein